MDAHRLQNLKSNDRLYGPAPLRGVDLGAVHTVQAVKLRDMNLSKGQFTYPG